MCAILFFNVFFSDLTFNHCILFVSSTHFKWELIMLHCICCARHHPLWIKFYTLAIKCSILFVLYILALHVTFVCKVAISLAHHETSMNNLMFTESVKLYTNQLFPLSVYSTTKCSAFSLQQRPNLRFACISLLICGSVIHVSRVSCQKGPICHA